MILELFDLTINREGDQLTYLAEILETERKAPEYQPDQLSYKWSATHTVCRGFVDWIQTTQTTQVLRCRNCGLREIFSLHLRVAADITNELATGRPRKCYGCAMLFVPKRPNQWYHAHACANRVRVAKHRAKRKKIRRPMEGKAIEDRKI